MNPPKNCIRDENIDYVLEHRWYDAKDFAKFATTGSPGGVATLSAGFNTTQQVLLGQMTGGMWGMRFSSLTDYATAPALPIVIPLWGMDNNWPIYFRILWTSDGATNTVATRPVMYWATLSGSYANNAGTSIWTGTQPRRPTTAISTTFATTTKLGTPSDVLQWSGYGAIAPLSTGGFANSTFPLYADFLSLELRFATLSYADVSTSFLWVAGLDVLFTPKKTFGPQSTREARHMMSTLGDQEVDPTTDF